VLSSYLFDVKVLMDVKMLSLSALLVSLVSLAEAYCQEEDELGVEVQYA
jgi:hypothetical protein